MTYPTELTGKVFQGIYVHEPSALVSNLAITIACFTIAFLNRSVSEKSSKNWMMFTISIGLGATGGIVTHGFPTYLSKDQFFALWWVKNDFVLIANFFASMAVVSYTKIRIEKLRWVLISKLVLGAILLFVTFSFLPAVIDLAFTYTAILVVVWNKKDDQSAILLKRSFLIALVSGFFYLFPFEVLEGWFTNKDAVHFFAIFSLFLIARAVRSMEIA